MSKEIDRAITHLQDYDNELINKIAAPYLITLFQSLQEENERLEESLDFIAKTLVRKVKEIKILELQVSDMPDIITNLEEKNERLKEENAFFRKSAKSWELDKDERITQLEEGLRQIDGKAHYLMAHHFDEEDLQMLGEIRGKVESILNKEP